MIDSWAVLATAAAGLEAGDPSVIVPGTRASPDGRSRVGLFEVADLPHRGITSWGTVGMSAFDNAVTTRDGRTLRVELVTAADAAWPSAGDALARCALLVAAGQSCTPDSVFRDAFADAGAATVRHAVFVPPFLWTRFPPLDDEHAVVTWLQAVPVTDAEAAYALENGVGALESRFEAAQPDLFDPARESVIPA